LIGGTTASNYIYFGDADDANAGQIRYVHSDDSMRLYAGATTERVRLYGTSTIFYNGATEIARFASSNRFGVGDPSPASKLTVARLGANWTGIAPDATTGLFVHNGNNGATSGASITLGAGNNSSSSLYFADDADSDIGAITYSHTDDEMIFRANNSPRMTLNTTGLGVGTTDPGQRLHVNSAGNTVAKISSTFNGSTTTGLYIDTVGDTSAARLLFSKSGVTRGIIGYSHNATANSEAITFGTAGGTERMRIDATGIDVTGTITFDGGTTSADLNFGDNDKAIFGAGSDLQIYHDGNNSRIDDAGTGNLVIRAANQLFLGKYTGENFIQGSADGPVRIFYDNAQKLETTSTGINVTGNATFDDNGKAIFGAGSDLQIYHDGNNSYIQENGTGDLLVGATNFQLKSGDYGESMLTATDDGAVTLFYNNASKLATTNTGIDVTGTLSATSVTSGGNAVLTSVKSFKTFMTADATVNGSTTYTTKNVFNTAASINVGGFSVATSGVTVPEDGVYMVMANMMYNSTVVRVNPGFRFAINGTGQPEEALSAYIRSASGHNEASSSLSTMYNLSANDVIGLQFAQEGAAGTVNLETGSHIAIYRVS
jgi:hypothetical protein